MLRMSPVLVIVERNLGFEAEHMARELRHLRSEKVSFWYDHNAERFGVLTTQVPPPAEPARRDPPAQSQSRTESSEDPCRTSSWAP